MSKFSSSIAFERDPCTGEYCYLLTIVWTGIVPHATTPIVKSSLAGRYRRLFMPTGLIRPGSWKDAKKAHNRRQMHQQPATQKSNKPIKFRN